ncbi:MAG TPA: zinc-binding dehydrogenase [Thermoleophilaceae bacterium]|jgi:NADPH2:quinone reductase|nr:zinc-binding dehydrogenase [Thermoleophilaceae bacterium]
MKAAVLRQYGAPPEYGEFEDPDVPDGHLIVDVEAAGVHHLDLLKASGTYYAGAPPLPSVVGGDGVGRLPDGRRVFFDSVLAPYGSMAERTVVPQDSVFEIADGVDSALAAALGNTGIVAWLALEWRARLERGETVAVLGATGAVGSAAVQIARELGAGRVVAADRAGERLAGLGADAVVVLDDDKDIAAAFKQAAPDGVDVIIDPLWGPPALAAMGAASPGGRHVQIGHIASPTLTLPATLVRSVALNLLGFKWFDPPLDVRRAAYLRLTELAARGGLTVNVEVLPLTAISSAWQRQQRADGTAKLVMACSSR